MTKGGFNDTTDVQMLISVENHEIYSMAKSSIHSLRSIPCNHDIAWATNIH